MALVLPSETSMDIYQKTPLQIPEKIDFGFLISYRLALILTLTVFSPMSDQIYLFSVLTELY
jgi:hypothetical protein